MTILITGIQIHIKTLTGHILNFFQYKILI